jgi:prepilin peptidase CpaA
MPYSVEAAVVVAVLACAFDLCTRRIPNVLTFGVAASALAAHAVVGGTEGLLVSAGGWLLGVALFFPFFAVGGLGGGDVKLLGALGACLGPAVILFVAFYSSLAGGAMAVVVAIRARYLRQALRNLAFLGAVWLTAGFRTVDGLTLEQADAPRLAYALPILAGLVVTLWRQ